MTTTLSSKGQLVLPSAARRRLGLEAGAKLACAVEGNHIILTPESRPAGKARFARNPASGLMVVAARRGARKVTSEQVRILLEEFP